MKRSQASRCLHRHPKITFEVKAGTSVNQSTLIYRLIWVILIVFVVQSCIILYEKLLLKAAGQLCDKPASVWWSAVSEPCPRVSTVFTLIKLQPNDARLLQNNHSHLHKNGIIVNKSASAIGSAELINPVHHRLQYSVLKIKSLEFFLT